VLSYGQSMPIPTALVLIESGTLRGEAAGVGKTKGGQVATVKKSFSLDERSARMLEEYARDLHISQSALVSMFITQLDQGIRTVVKQAASDEIVEEFEEKYGAGGPGSE